MSELKVPGSSEAANHFGVHPVCSSSKRGVPCVKLGVRAPRKGTGYLA